MLFWLLFVLGVVGGDPYVEDVHRKCLDTKRPSVCAKFNLVKFIENKVDYFSNFSLANSSIKILKLSTARSNNEQSYLTQKLNSDLSKLLAFIQRKFDQFVQEHAVGVYIPEEVRIVEDHHETESSRKIRKRHRFLMIPILVLAAIFKANILIGIVLFGILVLKKILLVAAFVFPAIIVSVKNACRRSYERIGASPTLDTFGWQRHEFVTSRYE